MIATATSIPAAVLYLLILFAEFLGGGGDLTVDYLQDGLPESRVSVTRPAADAREILRIVADADDAEPTVYVVEASDLAGHNYLVYAPDRSIPFVLNLAPALEQLSVAQVASDWSLELSGDAELSSAELEVDLGATVYFLQRDDSTIVSLPDPGVLLIVVEE